MLIAVKLQVSGSAIKLNCEPSFAGNFASRRPLVLRLRKHSLASISVQCDNAAAPSMSRDFTSSVGFSPPTLHISPGNLTQRYFLLLYVIACATAVSATWLFCSAIPALLAFKRAAESIEKLSDVMREELPDTMATVRLSGMEISDLTMELSDLGQKINQGVKSSTRAVHLAEEKFHWLTNRAPSASMQEAPSLKTKTTKLMLAKSAKGIREAVVKIRAIFQMFFMLTRFSRATLSYFHSRSK